LSLLRSSRQTRAHRPSVDGMKRLPDLFATAHWCDAGGSTAYNLVGPRPILPLGRGCWP